MLDALEFINKEASELEKINHMVTIETTDNDVVMDMTSVEIPDADIASCTVSTHFDAGNAFFLGIQLIFAAYKVSPEEFKKGMGKLHPKLKKLLTGSMGCQTT